MRIRIFRAPTLAEAMAQIRAELGADAMILSDRRRANFVEVTAALETSDPLELRAPVTARNEIVDLEPFTSPWARSEGRLQHLAQSIDAATTAALAWHGLTPALVTGLGGTALESGSLEQACTRMFRFAPIELEPGCDPVLLAGPPGGGKTLTVARLATRLVLAGRQPLVITADGKRAGAVEQLAAFTRLLGLTTVVANTPAILVRALERREADQPVLIDAPGLDLQDPGEHDLLQQLRSASGAAMALVLPSGLDPNEAQEIACAHAGLGARFLVATRVDQSRRLGGILCAARTSGLALAEAGIGSAAADSLVPITPGFVAERLRRGGVAPRQATPPPQIDTADDRTTRSVLSLHIAAQRRAASIA